MCWTTSATPGGRRCSLSSSDVLFGAILAFVGAAQLRRIAPDTTVANLVGLALVRKFSAAMNRIVLAGRIGGAYAARIAITQSNEEIDALQQVQTA